MSAIVSGRARAIFEALSRPASPLDDGVLTSALSEWDAIAPVLRSAFDDFLDRTRPVEASTLLIALHLFAHRADGGVFDPLCRLLLDAAASRAVLGEGIESNLCGILITTFNGDAGILRTVAACKHADEDVRIEAMKAIAYLTACGRIDMNATSSFLRRLHDDVLPDSPFTIAVCWAMAVAFLSLSQLRELARALLAEGDTLECAIGLRCFDADMCRVSSSTDRLACFREEGIGPLHDPLGSLRQTFASKGSSHCTLTNLERPEGKWAEA